MMDKDLAELYGVKTMVLNQAVKRNINRFPSDFMFQLSKEEMFYWKSQFGVLQGNKQESTNLISQFVTSSWGGTRKPPLVFTEHGIAMLSGVLKNPKAVQVNIKIIRAFIKLRLIILLTFISSHTNLMEKNDQ